MFLTHLWATRGRGGRLTRSFLTGSPAVHMPHASSPQHQQACMRKISQANDSMMSGLAQRHGVYVCQRLQVEGCYQLQLL